VSPFRSVRQNAFYNMLRLLGSKACAIFSLDWLLADFRQTTALSAVFILAGPSSTTTPLLRTCPRKHQFSHTLSPPSSSPGPNETAASTVSGTETGGTISFVESDPAVLVSSSARRIERCCHSGQDLLITLYSNAHTPQPRRVWRMRCLGWQQLKVYLIDAEGWRETKLCR